MELVVYREFPDGENEIGVLTIENGYAWIDVEDFDYCHAVTESEYSFVVIGVL